MVKSLSVYHVLHFSETVKNNSVTFSNIPQSPLHPYACRPWLKSNGCLPLLKFDWLIIIATTLPPLNLPIENILNLLFRVEWHFKTHKVVCECHMLALCIPAICHLTFLKVLGHALKRCEHIRILYVLVSDTHKLAHLCVQV
mgnify:CR=1 FL=1